MHTPETIGSPRAKGVARGMGSTTQGRPALAPVRRTQGDECHVDEG